MVNSKFIISKFFGAILFLAICMFPSMHMAMAQTDSSSVPMFSPVVNGEAVRGLTTIGSAESMGAGRITFSFLAPWYKQQIGYLNTPNSGTNIFTGVGAFSYGVNSYVDLFASVAGFAMSNYTNSGENSGLGTIRAGVQGSLPFPKRAFLRMGGQTAIIGGTSSRQINTSRADGYNYFETRTGYSFSGKLMQTALVGTEDKGVKFHMNEAGVLGINQKQPNLLLLGAGLQVNISYVVLGAEINSRTQFNDMSIGTDPLWFTPSIHFRTPYHMNAMAGVDISLSANRTGNEPRALEPYRVFGSLAFSFDLLADKRKAALEQKQKTAQEKIALENKANQSAQQVKSLTAQSAIDSASYANDKESDGLAMDSMQRNAGLLATKATTDSLALIKAAKDLALEKEKRSDAEKQLLSTGGLLLDAVYFETDKTIISINSKPYLNIIGTMLLKYPKLQIEVEGHTDNVGSQTYNNTLSQGRAEAVRNYLTEVAPALRSNLDAHGYGMSKSKADNSTPDGRLANRRVELRVKNVSALEEYNR